MVHNSGDSCSRKMNFKTGAEDDKGGQKNGKETN